MVIKYIDRKTNQIKVETPPSVGLLKFIYNSFIGEKIFLPLVTKKFISAWYGKKMDRSSSTNKIKDFVSSLKIDMTESAKEISEFTSFNDFFYRKLKPSARPLESDFVSPGDGKLLAFENISDLDHFFVKGREFSLTEFLGDENSAKKYNNSSLLILRLAPNDYHRYHFPCDGIPTQITKIKGNYLSVSPLALAKYFTKVFCENKREYCELKTKDKGTILLAPVGATMVGSILHTYLPNQEVEKGAEMGYFKFGGSTVVILIDKEKIKIDKDILNNTKNKLETFVKMGEKIAF